MASPYSNSYSAPPLISNAQTRGVANNQIASAQQASAYRPASAGAGLSRGKGQQGMARYASAMGNAAGRAQASNTQSEDAYGNANMQSAYRSGVNNENQQLANMADQRKTADWNYRFGGMTNAWNALAGLMQ